MSKHTEWLTINYAPDGKTTKAYRIVIVDGEPLVYRPEVDDFGVAWHDEDASHDQEVLGEAVRQLRSIKRAVDEFGYTGILADIFTAARLWFETTMATPPEANTAPIASEVEANTVDVGDGYRRLGLHEIVQDGDEFRYGSGWRKCATLHKTVVQTWGGNDAICRRPITKTATLADFQEAAENAPGYVAVNP